MEYDYKFKLFGLPCSFPPIFRNVTMLPTKKTLFFCFCLLIGAIHYGQDSRVSSVFNTEAPMSVRLSFSIKNIKKMTNDSTYSTTQLFYADKKGNWQSIDAKIRKRGNFRLKTCYYPPLKIKFPKKAVANTPFDKNRKFKMVTPCFRDAGANDFVLKELIAYKLYEELSPFHFRTQLLDIDFEEVRSKKSKKRAMKGFLIEDIEDVAKRLNARELKRKVHPMEQDARVSIINAFFQCMIGNTDFSTGYQHNQKLLFKDGESYPVPYDFDMSGLVNPPYATVSKIQGKQLPIEKVTQRLYRGFIRDRGQIFEVRQLFLDKKEQLLSVMDNYKPYFESVSEYRNCKAFVAGFFKDIEDGDRFEHVILKNLREKLPLDTITPQ
jgi:hypothetical protein